MKLLDVISASTQESALSNRVQGPILIGLSGGADSIALLYALLQLRENGILISAVHVNHRLRKSSIEDAEFCKALCMKLKVPLKIAAVNVSRTGSIEASARQARYNAFYDTMKEINARTLALAHHADDQAETVLMHLFYGTGAKGLSGMQEYNDCIWRPLLNYRHAELVSALQEIGQTWREDETNDDTRYTRNYLRHRVLPSIENVFPEAVRAINRTAFVLHDENEWIQKKTDEWLSTHASKSSFHFIEISGLSTIHTALQRRIMMTYAANLGLSIEFSHVEQLRTAVECKKKVNLPCGWHAVATYQRLHFMPPHQEKVIWNKSAINIEPIDKDLGDGRLKQAIPADLLKKAVIRTRQAGDRIIPFGMKGSMKLKDYFIERGLDQPFRDSWPILCDGSDVLWVIGIGASQLLNIENREKAVMLHFIEKLPDSL